MYWATTMELYCVWLRRWQKVYGTVSALQEQKLPWMVQSCTQLCKTYTFMISTCKSSTWTEGSRNTENEIIDWDQQMIPNSDICIGSWMMSRTLTTTKEQGRVPQALEEILYHLALQSILWNHSLFFYRYWMWRYHLLNTSLWNTVVSDKRV